jgi:DNA ligase-associated metallophosphoesterase
MIGQISPQPPAGVFVLGDLWLWPGYGISRPAHSQLMVADVHLGKAASFRAQGVPVPEQVTEETLERLSILIRASEAKTLIVLGDLIHDRLGLAGLLPVWRRWRDQHPQLELKLIMGNHDRKAAALAIESNLPGLQVLSEPFHHAALAMAHESKALFELQGPNDAAVLGLCGHEHPVVLMPDALKSKRLRRPCFYLDHQRILHLPAFGSFTGGHPVHLAYCKRLFVDTVDAVQEISAVLLQQRLR